MSSKMDKEGFLADVSKLDGEKKVSEREVAIEEIEQKSGLTRDLRALVGFDGFIDKIIHPVDKRMGEGANFKRIETINAFGDRIKAAAGRSCNIEFYPCMEKLGGNGPIFANAVLSMGCRTRYIGALGKPVAPVFEDFCKKTQAISICEPAVTHAAEFFDGKILFGTMLSLSEVTYDNIRNQVGKDAFLKLVDEANLIAPMNWTMLTGMSSVLDGLLREILPQASHKQRVFFFDLADPEKRSVEDIRQVLNVIARFQDYGKVILSLNLKESQKIHEILSFSQTAVDKEGIMKMASEIRNNLGIDTVTIHPCDSAVCATTKGSFFTEGPYVEKPFITTGAGDHFNAAFAVAQLLNFSPVSSLLVAVCCSGFYVRTGKTPTFQDIDNFIKNWRE